MKKIIIILFSHICVILNATNYYVSTTGNDNNSGTILQPWATLLQAFTSTSVLPGDSVFIRGGVYNIITDGTGVRCTRNGTSDNWITYINYPNEKPIMDFGNMTAGDITYPGLRNDGVVLSEVNYIKLYGLTVRNVKQYFNRNYARGIYLRDGIVTIENCIVYDCWGHGIHSQFSVTAKENDTHYIINCDSFNNCDSISGDPLGSNAGATGAGFDAWTDGINGKTYFINCRAWGNSDQGYSIGSDAYMRAEGCWSFANKGYVKGDGGGFKLGWQNIDIPDLRREIINCVATYNDSYGFFTNENGSGTEEEWNAVKSNHYNNISYNNEGYGFIIQNTRQSEELQRWRNFSNNISYKNWSGNVFDAAGAAKYSGSNNSWDIPLTVNDNDFIGLDTMGMTTSRQPDGTLPNNNFYNRFLKLSPTSNLVNAGINVGLPYKGSAPDLGPFESDYGSQSETNILSFSLSQQTGSATINTTNHTVFIEVAYGTNVTSLTPSITVSQEATISPASGVTRNFSSPVSYTVSNSGASQVWTVTVVVEQAPEPVIRSSILHGNRWIIHGNKIVKIE